MRQASKRQLLETPEKDDTEKQAHLHKYYSDEKENTVPNCVQGNDGKMLKYGEFSPNNPRMRVATQPYLGLGEYEQRKQFLMHQRKAEYTHYMNQVQQAVDQNAYVKNNFTQNRPVLSRDKAVQTDIQNIQTQLFQRNLPNQAFDVQGKDKNNIIGRSKYLDRGGNTDSPRAKLMADLQSSYFPSFSTEHAPVHSQDDDKIEKVRRQEKYLAELRQQVEEKQHLLQKHKEQERSEQDFDNKRFNKLNIDDRTVLGEGRSMDVPVPNKISLRNNYNGPKMALRYTNTNSPPVSRRNHPNNLAPPYSFNIPSNSVFAKNINNTVSVATVKQNQILKGSSPVAKDLIHSQPVTSSSKTSDQMKNLEAKWQIPAMQKNVENRNDGILTQLGAIRLQLQQEQLRLDETLKTRGLVQTTADIHHFH